MYFIVIMAFALVLSTDLPTPGLDLFSGRSPIGWPVLPGTLAIAIGPVILVSALSYYFRHKMLARTFSTPGEHDELVRSFSKSQTWLTGIIAISLATTMVCTPWAKLVRDVWNLDRFPLVGDLFLLAPFFSSLTLAWIIQFPVEMKLKYASLGKQSDNASQSEPSRASEETLGAYLFDKYRHQILVVAAPMIVIVFAKHYTDSLRANLQSPDRLRGILELIRRNEAGVWDRLSTQSWVSDAILGIVSVVVLVLAPVMLRFVWSTEPLPAGPLRERFERICARIGLRYREILLWRTHGLTVNAAVMGFIPQMRYVLVSDALIESMNDDEIEAVFGHEAGHVQHWHLPFFGAFAALSMYVSGGIVIVFESTGILKDVGTLQMVGLVALLLTWLFGFGWLSRRFERQADLFGVRCVTSDIGNCRTWCPVHGEPQTRGLCISAANLFGRTLMKIAALNGIPRRAPSWRHGSIESRCQLIERLAANPTECARFDRSLLRIKLGLAILTVIGTIGGAAVYYDSVARAFGWRNG